MIRDESKVIDWALSQLSLPILVRTEITTVSYWILNYFTRV